MFKVKLVFAAVMVSLCFSVLWYLAQCLNVALTIAQAKG